MFKIGERNIAATKKILIGLGITVIKADIGGVSNRALQLDIETGEVLLKTTIGTAKLSLA
jgi:chemotaxis receptor (MCP) glutamine deamidase CheD